MTTHKTLRQILLANMLLVATLACVLVGSLWIGQEIYTFNALVTKQSKRLIEERKERMQKNVDSALAYLDFMRSKIEERARNLIYKRTIEAHQIATHLYETWKDKKSRAELESMVREALRPIRFLDGRGYYFATRLDGVEMLCAACAHLEGKNLLDLRNTQGAYIIRDMGALVRKDGEGFYRYIWDKPETQGREHHKIAYVKHFAPFDWFIGTGEYVEDTEQDLQQEALEWIRRIRYDDAYLFAGRWDGTALSGPATGKNMLGMTDLNGVKVVQEMIRLARENGGFVEYVMPKIEGQLAEPKISYIRGLPAWEWYIGTGLYIDDIENMVAESWQQARTDLFWNIAQICAILALLWLGAFWLAARLNARTHVMFQEFSGFFSRGDKEQAEIPIEMLAIDEFRELAEGANRMIARRRIAEESLRESENKYKDLFNSIPVGYHQYDTEGRLVLVNATELEILGYSEEEMLGRYVWEFVEEGELSRKSVLDKLAGNSIPTTGFERNYHKKDGTYVAFLIEDRILRDSADNITGIRSIAMDITERKLAEEALRISEERYRVAFQTNQDVININRLNDGLLIEANQSFFDIHGFDRDEVIGRTTQELNIWVEPAERQRFVEVLQRDSKCFNFEARFRRKNGELIWGLVSASVIELDGTPCVFSIRRDITERKRSEEIINHLAYFDQLTDLPNRTLLQDRLKQAMASSQRSGRYGALLLLDLDYFKTLNDTLGHDMGDLLLKQVAQRLTECMREEDTVTRQGGDEFVVMLVSLSESQIEAASLVELIGEKISAAFSLPFDLREIAYRISPSIGASLFLGQQTDIDMLLKQADLAMYKAKEAGRNTLRFFDPDMASDVLKRAALDNDLRDALQKEQFVLHYQAQMNGNQVTGAEALLRWQHPERGLVFPGEFIPFIEETGRILPVGQWVVETACQQLAAWAIQPEMSHLTVAVNISAHQLNHGDFVDQVLRALELSGANPNRLKLELTESLLVNHVEEIIGKMTVLKAKGVGFSLDDFGTGYSSLAYLKRLPLDQLKIDQSFVRDILTDPNDAAIARMIVVLAETLGLAVIAEGVETEAQRDSLLQQGCHGYQGYLFSRPVPLDEFETFVKRG